MEVILLNRKYVINPFSHVESKGSHLKIQVKNRLKKIKTLKDKNYLQNLKKVFNRYQFKRSQENLLCQNFHK